jgi:DNA-binding NarL/FixJ family response regulator
VRQFPPESQSAVDGKTHAADRVAKMAEDMKSIAHRKVRVLLVDDHKLFRQGMRRLLELDDGVEVVGEADTGERALAEVQLSSPDVVLMDVRIPGIDGVETTRRLKQAYPSINVIMLTSYAEEYVPEAIEAGASGYLLKSVSHEELSKAIRSVHLGESVIDRSLSRDLFRRFGELRRANKEGVLSVREVEIMRLLASGMSGRSVAAKLFISDTTLKREMRHILARLGVETRAQAIAEACRHGLL